jgi:Zn-dependent peptidase ImmA (M78 family)
MTQPLRSPDTGGDKKQSTRWMEEEANLFAMCLLMPEQLVRQEVEKMGGFSLADDESIKHLAKVFDVPLTAMAVRLSQIKFNP